MNLIIVLILGITVLVSFLSFSNRELFYKLSFNPYSIQERKQWYRYFSYAFIHADWFHLAINMYVLYVFADQVLDSFLFFFGPKGYLFFLLLYIGGIVFSVVKDYGQYKNEPMYNAVGASGAVSAIVFASIIILPSQKLFIFPLPIPLPAYIMGVLYLVYSAYMAKRGKDNIGHNAHFWGAVFGVVFTLVLRPSYFSEFIQSL
ncbi:MAG: rhomboid family intramembrane serine protease [Bacteroidales bacterium]|nr:rhomboid family intramembrane serine protease [Bacteroidales bacterium]